MRGLLYLIGEDTLFTLFQKTTPGDLFKSCCCLGGTCHLRGSTLTFSQIKKARGHLWLEPSVTPPTVELFLCYCLCIFSESCTGTPCFIALCFIVLHNHCMVCFFFTNWREYSISHKIVVVWNQTHYISRAGLHSIAIKNERFRMRHTWL